jgi:hypothetical protein
VTNQKNNDILVSLVHSVINVHLLCFVYLLNAFQPGIVRAHFLCNTGQVYVKKAADRLQDGAKTAARRIIRRVNQLVESVNPKHFEFAAKPVKNGSDRNRNDSMALTKNAL